MAQAQQYIAAGYGWVVDLDLEKFFDRVNHDKLMGQIAKRIGDKRLLKLIRAFLNAGVMENGLVSPSVEGTPQGGPLSPLLSNIVLDELDRELERRGHRFVRYADDCNIYVRSEQAGQRVMESVKRFITQTAQAQGERDRRVRWRDRRSGSFSDSVSRDGPEIRRTIAPKAVERFKERIREITRQARRRELGADDGGPGPVYAGLARLLRVLRNAGRADPTDRLGTPAPSGGAMAAMEDSTPSPGDADSTGRAWRTGAVPRLPAVAVLGICPHSQALCDCALERLLPLSRFAFVVRSVLGLTISNRRVRTRTHGGVAGVGG